MDTIGTRERQTPLTELRNEVPLAQGNIDMFEVFEAAMAANDDIESQAAAAEVDIMALRCKAQLAWLELLNILGRIHADQLADPTLFDDELNREYFYGSLFETLFDHGPVEMDSDFLDILAKAGRDIEMTPPIRAKYEETRKELVDYMIGAGFISSEKEFVANFDDLILFVGCFATEIDLKNLQAHIEERRGGASETEALSMDQRLHVVRERAISAATPTQQVQLQ